MSAFKARNPEYEVERLENSGRNEVFRSVNTAEEKKYSRERFWGVEKRVTKIGRALGGNVVAFYSPIEVCMEI